MKSASIGLVPLLLFVPIGLAFGFVFLVFEFYEGGFELGATELEPVSEVGEGVKVAAVKDPFGNRLGIIENPNLKISEVL